MTTKPSKTQIDHLGDRLRKGPLVEADLKVLDDYRRSFGLAYESVVRAIREHTQLEPTGRPAKSTGALIEKLHRETIRLTQVQDIAGCRIIVPDILEQDRVVASLRTVFPDADLDDRREDPSYGYRAVHIVVQFSGSLVEIQVRSSVQHIWAELSEKLSDVVDSAIKYGGGPPDIQDLLANASSMIASFEKLEEITAELEASLAAMKQFALDASKKDLGEAEKQRIADATDCMERDFAHRSKELIEEKEDVIKMLNELVIAAHTLKGKSE